MSLFRRKALNTVDAVQYKEGGPLPRGVYMYEWQEGTASPHTFTIQGQWARVTDGDWIIDEGDGEHFYPCAPDVFEQNYEPFIATEVKFPGAIVIDGGEAHPDAFKAFKESYSLGS